MTYGRQHIWLGDRCQRCAMKSSWEGAKHPCEGIGTPVELARALKANRDKRRNARIYGSPELLDVRREYQRERAAQKRSAS